MTDPTPTTTPLPAIGPEWQPCVKLPITVHVREQRPGERHISTREGITPVREDDLIMRGVQGEEYPIGREVFSSTYRMGEATQPAATREAVEPTYMEVVRLRDELDDGYGVDLVVFARTVLARWGGAAVQPVPVSERPWERPGWLDAEGYCWCFAVGRNWRSGYSADRAWMLRHPEPDVYDTHSLPHWALPVPAAGKGEVQA